MWWFKQPIKCKHPAESLRVASDSSKEQIDAETMKITIHMQCNECGINVNFIYRTVTGKKGEALALEMARGELNKIMKASKNG